MIVCQGQFPVRFQILCSVLSQITLTISSIIRSNYLRVRCSNISKQTENIWLCTGQKGLLVMLQLLIFNNTSKYKCFFLLRGFRGASLPAVMFESHVVCFCGVPAIQYLRAVELLDVNVLVVALSWVKLSSSLSVVVGLLFFFFLIGHHSEKAFIVEKNYSEKAASFGVSWHILSILHACKI